MYFLVNKNNKFIQITASKKYTGFKMKNKRVSNKKVIYFQHFKMQNCHLNNLNKIIKCLSH